MGELANRLRNHWQRYNAHFRVGTRDSSDYAHAYLQGQLVLETERNFARIARATGVDEQAMHHFMSNSPWSAPDVLKQTRAEVNAEMGDPRKGALLLDESGDERASDYSIGAGRQHNGRHGKVDLCQVGVYLSYSPDRNHAQLIDGELYLQTDWFGKANQVRRKKLKLPTEREFQPKAEIGLTLIRRAQQEGLAFGFVSMDGFYGQQPELLADLRAEALVYMAEIPAATRVYVNKPLVGVPETPPGKRGPRFKRERVLDESHLYTVAKLAHDPERMRWERLTIRSTARGVLGDEFAALRVWTQRDELPEVRQWLVVRRHGDEGRRCSYALCNAAADTRLPRLAEMKCRRYFVERSLQEGKSEVGLDELEAHNYQAWMHHLALTALALWFITQTQRDWAVRIPRDDTLTDELRIEALPELSLRNVRELLRTVLPLPQLTEEAAIAQVVKHLVNRTRSRRSRLNRQRQSTRGPIRYVE